MTRSPLKGSGFNLQEAVDAVREAGYDVLNPLDQDQGLLAHNVARLVWERYAAAHRTARRDPSKAVGRNELCPCGSGLKYKKCCWSRQASTQAPAPEASLIPFGPQVIPNVSTVAGLSEGMEALGRMMEQDPALRRVRFDQEKVAAFTEQAVKDGRLGPDTPQEAVDVLGLTYAAQSGEEHLVARLKDDLQDAAERATSADQLRCLTFGVLWSMSYREGRRTESLLSLMLFRLTSRQLWRPTAILEQLVERLGDPSEVLPKLASGDPAVLERMRAEFDLLGDEDLDAINEFARKMDEELAQAIRAGSFPVLLPLASVTPILLGAASLVSRSRRPSAKDLSRFVALCADQLGEADARLYVAHLERWLDDHPHADHQIARLVRQMLESTRVLRRPAQDFLLLLQALRTGGFATDPDEAEARIVETWTTSKNDPEFLSAHASWLEAKGYPTLAARTRGLIGTVASTDTAPLPP